MARKTDNLISVVEKAKAGDQRAFVKLCEMKINDVLMICHYEIRDYHDAEDAAQEVFMRLQEKIKLIDKPEFFNTWLTRLAINTCRQMGRNSMKQPNQILWDDLSDSQQVDPLDVLPQSYVEDSELRRRVLAAVERLGDGCRQCVVLHYFQGMSHQDIADTLDMTPAVVNYNLVKARKLLSVELEEEQKTKAWAISPMLAFGPALHQMFAKEAASIPVATSKAILDGAGIHGAFTIKSAIGAAASAAGIGYGVKAVLQIIAIVTAVGIGGTAIAFTTHEVLDPTPPPASQAPAEPGLIPQEEIDPSAGAQWGDEDPVLITAHSLSGRVILDDSGVTDSNARMGLSGLTVELVDAETDEVVETTKTGNDVDNGLFYLYTFKAGEYRVRVLLPNDAETVSGGKTAVTSGDRAVWLEIDGGTTITLEGDEPLVVSGYELVLRYQSTISGRVTVAAGESELLHLLPTTTVDLLDPQGRAVATTAVDAEGGYTFKNPAVSQNGTYTLRFSLDNQVGLHVPFDSYPLALKPGESKTIPTQAMTDTSAPLISIALTGGDCDCGHVNPDSVEVTLTDTTDVVVNWTLVNRQDGSDTAGGTSVDALNNAIQGLTRGNYNLVITATDAAGNSTTAEQLIRIY